MFSYLAALWNPQCSQERDAAEALDLDIRAKRPLWDRHLVVPGMSVYSPRTSTCEGDSIPLPGQTGILLGVAFARTETPQSLRRDASTEVSSCLPTDELITSCGKLAIDKLWGSYVLLISTRDSRARYVLRSPAGTLACFHARARGIHVFFSTVEDYLLATSDPISINWPVLRAQAAGDGYLTDETALDGITELECGACACHADSGLTRSFYWNPCEISRRPPISRFQDAVASVRRETSRATHSWASRHRTILLELSGGLDSSIVLAGLATAPSKPQIYCANYYSIGSHFDERRYARSMAEKWRTPLLEYELDAACDLSLFERCARTARPVLSYTAPGRFRAIAEFASKHGCDVVADGELGDNVFGNPFRAEPVTDYFERHGTRPGALFVARDVARLKRLSVWSALASGLSYSRNPCWTRNYPAFVKGVMGLDIDSLRFITREALHQYESDLDRFAHPWLKQQCTARPGSVPLIQAMLIATSTALHAPFSIPDSPAYVRPLVSQPLIEVALRIPGALTIRNGWNRAVARAAFATELSHEVRLRTDKANSGPWISKTIRRNAAWLREFLLGGVLAREHILDAKRVDEALSGRISRSNASLGRLFVYAYMEGWLRQWVS
jgi:asparagine synthase (glutamine-hydrolysing)